LSALDGFEPQLAGTLQEHAVLRGERFPFSGTQDSDDGARLSGAFGGGRADPHRGDEIVEMPEALLKAVEFTRRVGGRFGESAEFLEKVGGKLYPRFGW